MNSLSWLIYLAGVLEKVGIFVIATGIISGAAAIVIGIAVGVIAVDGDDSSKPQRALWVALTVFSASFLVGAIIPSRATMYAIAASEIGEDVLSSDTAKEVGDEAAGIARDSLKVIRKFLDERLEDQKK